MSGLAIRHVSDWLDRVDASQSIMRGAATSGVTHTENLHRHNTPQAVSLWPRRISRRWLVVDFGETPSDRSMTS